MPGGWAESRRTQQGLALLSHQCRVWVQAGQDRIPLEDSVHKHTNKDIRLGWTPSTEGLLSWDGHLCAEGILHMPHKPLIDLGSGAQ